MAKKILRKKKKVVNKFPIPLRILKMTDYLESMFSVHNYDRTYRRLNKDEDDKAAQVSIEEDYQRINVDLFPVFFKSSPREQRLYLLHEFCHIFTDPLNQITKNLMQGKVETPEHKRVALEKSTSSIANLVDSLLCGRYKNTRKAYTQFIRPPRKKG